MKRYIRSAIHRLADEPFSIQEEIVCDIDTDPEILMELSNSTYAPIRYDIVWHDNVTEEILKKLANDTNVGVQKAVATNPKTPSEIADPLYQKLADQGYF